MAAKKKTTAKTAKKTKKPAQKEQAQKVKKAAKPKPLPAGKGPIGYTTSNTFKMPLKKVWDAVVLSKHLKKHFVDDMKGEFSAKLEPVSWYWKEWDWVKIDVLKFEKNKEIVMQWPDWENKYLITARFEFERKIGKTIFRVHESGYPKDHLQKAFMMCEGWTEFHCGVKAYLKWGVNLNKS